VRLRQIAVVASDLDAAVDALVDGLGREVCFRDPGVGVFGLRNALLAVGDQFLEVVSPVRDGTTAGRYLERRGGDAGYMALVQADDLDVVRRRLADLGARVVFEADGPGIHGLHVHPADIGGAIVSIDVADPPGSWGWAGSDWSAPGRTGQVGAITAVEVATRDPAGTAARWGALLDLPVEADQVRFADAVARFTPVAERRDEGIVAIGLRATDPADVGRSLRVAGVRVDLTP
jgi:hypothetical protein